MKPIAPQLRIAGPEAASTKYDILTALTVDALRREGVWRTSILRLLAVITARYDWRRGELRIGREELSRLWGVSLPTVKRELARLKNTGFLKTLQPGVRGRVTVYTLNIDAISETTCSVWTEVGDDYATRMEQICGPARKDTNIVRFPTRTSEDADDIPDAETIKWRRRLAADHPQLFPAWFSRLTLREEGDRALKFEAPSRFIADYISTHLMERLRQSLSGPNGPDVFVYSREGR